MNIKTITNYFMTTISLFTAMGVFMHDSRVDKASTIALSSVVSLGYAPVKTVSGRYSDFMSSDAHTHPDHNAANKSLISSFFYQSPSVAPKRKSHRKELARQTAEPRHAFDNANLPILE